MQTYSIEAAKADLAVLLHRVEKGEEVLITENNKPLAKIVSADENEAYRRDVRALRGFAKGMDTNFYREEDDRI